MILDVGGLILEGDIRSTDDIIIGLVGATDND